MTRSDLEQFIDRAKYLPPAPKTLIKLLEIQQGDQDCDVSTITQIISLDAGLSASIIRLCNSVVMRGELPIASIEESVLRLGFKEIFQTAASICVEQSSKPRVNCGLEANLSWIHSVVTAIATQTIAQHAHLNETSAFMAGLLHDIGKLVMGEVLGRRYAEIIAIINGCEYPEVQSEREHLGVDHAAIGGHLLEKWGMPQEISEAVCFHHQADRNEAPSALAAATYLGNNIAHFLGYGDKTQAPTFHQHQATMERLELGAQQIAYILIATHHGLERAMAMLSLRKTIL